MICGVVLIIGCIEDSRYLENMYPYFNKDTFDSAGQMKCLEKRIIVFEWDQRTTENTLKFILHCRHYNATVVILATRVEHLPQKVINCAVRTIHRFEIDAFEDRLS